MAQFATDTDLLEYVPDIKKYGIQEFLTEHEKNIRRHNQTTQYKMVANHKILTIRCECIGR